MVSFIFIIIKDDIVVSDNKWEVYEKRKQKLRELVLTDEEYNRMIRELCDELEL